MTARNIDRVRLVASLVLAMSVTVVVAGQGRGTPIPVPAAKAAAPIDVTGYWVAVVNKEWRFRILILRKATSSAPSAAFPSTRRHAARPRRGIPRRTRRPARHARGLAQRASCESPGVCAIGWEDHNALRVDTDAGMQTRVLHFGTAPPRCRASREAIQRRAGSVCLRRESGTRERVLRGHTLAGARQLRGRDDKHASGIPAQERRALQLQCECLDDGGPATSSENRTEPIGSSLPRRSWTRRICRCRMKPVRRSSVSRTD